MKRLKVKSRFLTVCLGALMISLLVVSCKKSKVRKDVEGTWNIESVVINGAAYPGTVEGTFIFGECSMSDNKKGNCSVTTDITYTLNGSSTTETSTFPFQVLKKGERILMDDAEFAVEVSDNTLRMEFNETGEQVIYTLIK
jgi:hypothetical protein